MIPRLREDPAGRPAYGYDRWGHDHPVEVTDGCAGTRRGPWAARLTVLRPGSHSTMRWPILDNTIALALEGYGWLPNRRRRTVDGVVQARLMGQRAVGLCGPDAARFFYDEHHVRRHTAIPEPVQGTLFGHRAVHTLDGDEHRNRKDMFMSVLGDDQGITALVEQTTAIWDKTVAAWPDGKPVVLFDEASRTITRGVCQWAGVPHSGDSDADALARDLVALVDGFATPGPRHWRARRARGRLESRLAQLVQDVRTDAAAAPAGSALEAVAGHRDLDGEPLDAQRAAVELINVIRPTVAVSWFVTFAGHALHRWPGQRMRLLAGDPAHVEAFVHEIRRFYPFAPFIGARAVNDLTWRGQPIPEGAIVLLDLYGQNHDPDLWPQPYTFDPARFRGRDIGAFDLVPQGGGDPRTGHRCPGERITLALLKDLTVRLAAMDYEVPEQDLAISLRRIPALPASRFILVPRTRPTT